MKNKRLVRVGAVLFLLGAFACRAPDPLRPKGGGEIRIGDFIKPSEINPITTDSTISSGLAELIFDNLVHYDAEQDEVRPEIAEKWEVSPDHLIWTFHLRGDARFHDGTPLGAEDVKYTFEAVMKTQRSGNSNAFASVKDVRIVDPRIVQVILSKPDNLLWTALSDIGIAPRHLLQGKPDYSEFDKHPIGSGPYRFLKQDEKEIVLEANPDYFGGRPYLDRVIVQILPSQKAALTNLIAGNIDMIFLLNPNDFGALSQIPAIKTYENWSTILYLLSFNLKNGFLGDSQVRKAMNYAIDRKFLVDRVLGGKGTAAAGSFALDSKDLNPDVSPYPYQPELAVRLLSERGWKDRDGDYILDKGSEKGEFSVIVMEGDNVGLKSLSILQEQLRQVGVKINIVVAAFDVYAQRIFQKRDIDGSFIFFVSSNLQDNNVNFWHSSQIVGGFNFSSYADDDVDRHLDAIRFSLEPGVRRQARLDFQKDIHDNPPGLFLFWRRMPIAVHKRFHGIPEKRMKMRDLVHVWESPEPRQEDNR